jgi:hypothetical protein
MIRERMHAVETIEFGLRGREIRGETLRRDRPQLDRTICCTSCELIGCERIPREIADIGRMRAHSERRARRLVLRGVSRQQHHAALRCTVALHNRTDERSKACVHSQRSYQSRERLLSGGSSGGRRTAAMNCSLLAIPDVYTGGPLRDYTQRADIHEPRQVRSIEHGGSMLAIVATWRVPSICLLPLACSLYACVLIGFACAYRNVFDRLARLMMNAASRQAAGRFAQRQQAL